MATRICHFWALLFFTCVCVLLLSCCCSCLCALLGLSARVPRVFKLHKSRCGCGCVVSLPRGIVSHMLATGNSDRRLRAVLMRAALSSNSLKQGRAELKCLSLVAVNGAMAPGWHLAANRRAKQEGLPNGPLHLHAGLRATQVPSTTHYCTTHYSAFTFHVSPHPGTQADAGCCAVARCTTQQEGHGGLNRG